MPLWLEALLGLAAIALCAVACWREDWLIAWEDKHLLPLIRRIRKISCIDRAKGLQADDLQTP